jgi:hypothetical protein
MAVSDVRLYPWEREALDLVYAGTLDIELHDPSNGRLYELDPPFRVGKSHPGTSLKTSWTVTEPDGRRRTIESPTRR